MLFNVLLWSYIFISLFIILELYLEDIYEEGKDSASLFYFLIPVCFIPLLSHIFFIGSIFGLITKFDDEDYNIVTHFRNKMHRVFKCHSCNINSYYGRVKQNYDKCPFCNSDNLEEIEQESIFNKEGHITEDAPLSLKMSFIESFSILRKITKVNRAEAKKIFKYSSEEKKKQQAIKEAQLEYAKVEFKDKQLEAYLKLQQEKLDEMIEKRDSEKEIQGGF